VYVIPAVETVHRNVSLPRSIASLREQLGNHSACAFYGHYCRQCHLPTNIQRFTSATEPYEVHFLEGYEPYVIVNRSSDGLHPAVSKELHPSRHGAYAKARPGLPPYDESFVGRGWDKMSFFYELHAQRRRFFVMPQYYIGHRGRGDTPAVLTEEYMRRQELNRNLMGDFKQRMEEIYGVPSSDEWIFHTPPVLLGRIAGSHKRPHDELLEGATTELDWGTLSSSLGFPKVCISKHRREGDYLAPQLVEKLTAAINWACLRLNCSTIEGYNEDPPLRAIPTDVVFMADWVMDRWYHLARSLGETDEQACSFQGLGSLVTRHEATKTPGTRLGCSVNHDFRANAADYMDVIYRICSVQLGGGCKSLFAKIHPLLRNDLRTRAAVALNAHHLVVEGGGTQATCREAFGDIAQLIEWPRSIHNFYLQSAPPPTRAGVEKHRYK
jgi:hypothetical protein